MEGVSSNDNANSLRIISDGDNVVVDENRDDSTNQLDALFTPLTATETIKRVVFLYLKSGTVRLFIKLSLLIVVPVTAILLTVVYMVMRFMKQQQDDDGNNSESSVFIHNFMKYVTILGSQSLLQTTLGTIAEGAITVAVANLYVSRHPHYIDCLKHSSKKALPLLVSGFVVGIYILIGYFFFYIPGLFIKLSYLVVTPVIVLEDNGYAGVMSCVCGSMTRSWYLVKGYRWYALKCLLGLDMLYWIINWVLRTLLREDKNLHPMFSLTFHLIKAIPATMIVPAFGILKATMYINLLVCKEGLNKERFVNQMDTISQQRQGGGDGESSLRQPLLQHQEDMEAPASTQFENIVSDATTQPTTTTTAEAIVIHEAAVLDVINNDGDDDGGGGATTKTDSHIPK